MKYIKAPKALASYLGLLNSRSMLDDGTYLLWDRDLMRLAGSGTVDELLPICGCVELTAAQVREEQAGGTPAELPPITLQPLLEHIAETAAQSAHGTHGSAVNTVPSRQGPDTESENY